uniref:Pyrokinin-3 n=4 Tax=Mantophasmatodea TaxID=192413 RepID=PPK3_MANKU|nr:RecName: Full=Pyrokinin-3; Short=PK-3; AltName: Full=FXPRL-amide [Mantophasma kudubergense]B3A0G8.1 RecName: Full=Pyrokinin-3; Short=PK-3 [Praedatophasma maraisi]B3A0I8.1 RecName: Full=Pyrokinin-3; Short=PK-3 [Tyrannophasma gladiator]B3A0K7.1 RecName: Full=Pyrokinin-3; Short=PK-3 [Pachyphasma brandbergense]
DPPFAPRM